MIPEFTAFVLYFDGPSVFLGIRLTRRREDSVRDVQLRYRALPKLQGTPQRVIGKRRRPRIVFIASRFLQRMLELTDSSPVMVQRSRVPFTSRRGAGSTPDSIAHQDTWTQSFRVRGEVLRQMICGAPV